MKHKVLVTGGNGFIGRHLIEALLRRDDETMICCLSRRRPEGGPWGPRVRWLAADLSDAASYREILEDTQDVFHLAAVLNSKRPEAFHLTNVLGTAALLEACRETAAPFRRFVLMSSIAAMGPDRQGGLLSETSPCSPGSEYGKSKRDAEAVARRYASSVPLVILRPSFVYGRGDRRGAHLLNSILTAGPSLLTRTIGTLSVCHVSDLVQACLQAAQLEFASGEVFIISDPEIYTWAKVEEILGEIFDRLGLVAWKERLRSLNSVPGSAAADPPAQTSSLQYWGCDVSKARAGLEFNPGTPLSQGAWDMISWYLQERLLTVFEEAGENAQGT